MDEIWYLEMDEAIRQGRLIRRHVSYGKSEPEARAWVLGNDERNATVVKATAGRADKIISFSPTT